MCHSSCVIYNFLVNLMKIKAIQNKFMELFHEDPLLIRSPGRVNLIGEHTDYNEGFVLPAAIDKEIILALAPSRKSKSSLYAADLNDSFEFQIDSIKKSKKGWPNYLLGVVDQFQKKGHKIEGFNCVFGGDIPVGAGLSSSAAIESGLAFALNETFMLGIDKLNLVKIAQKAENEFVGVRCGIMDQFVNIFGAKNKVLKLDCRSLAYEYFPFMLDDVSIVLCDTQVSHSLASSEYNIRRQQCEIGVSVLKKTNQNIRSLRDVTVEMLESYRKIIDPMTYKRCFYVIYENSRLIAACDDLKKGDLKAFGEKIYRTHAGLRDDYEVSCPELDFLVDLTLDMDDVLGSRMMGGGFGGCTINLIKQKDLDEIVKEIQRMYKLKWKKNLNVYVTSIEAGTSIIKDDDPSVENKKRMG